MKKIYFLITLFLMSISFYAQEQTLDSIKKENVLVEFSYNPTLTDVFKLKTEPELNTSHKSAIVNYKINPKKVKSDFTPAAPKAKYVSIDKRSVKIYENYIYGAIGLYSNTELAVILNPEIIKKYDFGLSLYSDTYQNGIDDTRVSNAKWDLNFSTFLAHDSQSLNWKTTFLYDRNAINWYGLNSNITDITRYEGLEFNQAYQKIGVEGKLQFKKSKIVEITPAIHFFNDAYSSSEVNLSASVDLNKSLFWDLLNTEASIQYISGKFKEDYTNTFPINYSFINLGIHPVYFYQSEKINVKLGLHLLMNHNIELGEASFLPLPTAIATVPIIEGLMTLQGGVRSNFNQNTYASLVDENNYVSPNLNILATHSPYEGFLGLQGKIIKVIHYDVEGGYQQINNLALYTHNNSTNAEVFDQPYQLGNSFGVVYRDAGVLKLKGDIKIELSKSLMAGATANYFNYSLEDNEQAWNLPSLKLESYLQYQKEKYFAQASVSVFGDRKDLVNNVETTVKGFLDVNVKAGYNFSKQFKAHVNVYNLLNSKYNSFNNYQVQGLQAVAGLSYQF